MLCLRPHHALCIQKFTGHGYDRAFTLHMTAIVSALGAAPDTPVLLTPGCDEVCGQCPNNRSGACVSLEKVRRIDEAVLALCGLAYGQTVTWRELSSTARERIFHTPEFKAVCSSCEWYGLCAADGSI